MKKRFTAGIAAACMLLSLWGCGSEKTAADKKPAEKTEEPAYSTYSGILKAVREVKVYSDGTGQVLECSAQEGDYVEAGALLYKLDGNGIEDSIAAARNSVAKADISIRTAQENVDNLKIYAPASGVLKNFSIKTGERVNTTTIGLIADESRFVARVPFSQAQLESIRTGSSAVVTSSDLMSSVEGSVTRIYSERNTSVPGAVLYDVEITGTNSGGLFEGMGVSAVINGQESPVSGSITESDTTALVSRGSGNAKRVLAKEGDYVKRGTLLVELDNDSVTAALERAKIDKEDLERNLKSLLEDEKDLYIYAPISGVVTERKKEERDSISSKSESVMTISDTSKLTLTLTLSDEDYTSLEEGDILDIECDGYGTVCGTAVSKSEPSVICIEIENTAGIMPNTAAAVTIS